VDSEVANDPMSRELRRLEFAKRLTWHRVRTGTIMRLTGLSVNRLTNCRKRWNVPENSRLRGSGPSSLGVFFMNSQIRADAAAVLSVCKNMDALPQPGRDYAPDGSLSIDVGIRLCEAYEAYHACRARSKLEFDDLMLLVAELSRGKAFRLGTCKGCRSTILVATFDGVRSPCRHCQEP